MKEEEKEKKEDVEIIFEQPSEHLQQILGIEKEEHEQEEIKNKKRFRDEEIQDEEIQDEKIIKVDQTENRKRQRLLDDNEKKEEKEKEEIKKEEKEWALPSSHHFEVALGIKDLPDRALLFPDSSKNNNNSLPELKKSFVEEWAHHIYNTIRQTVQEKGKEYFMKNGVSFSCDLFPFSSFSLKAEENFGNPKKHHQNDFTINDVLDGLASKGYTILQNKDRSRFKVF